MNPLDPRKHQRSAPAKNPAGVDAFFDQLTSEYAEAIERCFPRYREMLWALLDYLPNDWAPQRVLELGCGTGNLSVLLAERFPAAQMDLIDVAQSSLQVCQTRLGNGARFRFRALDFRNLDHPDDSADLVISSIAVHHLDGEEKRQLFARLFRILRPGGLFAYADQHAGVTEGVNQRHRVHWHTLSMEAGSSDAEWQMWMQHQSDHDHHDTTVDQIDWLRQAGFRDVDCPWRYLLWTVLQATKPS